MATEILSLGIDDAVSTDAVLADGESATLIKRGDGVIEIQIASTVGYVLAGTITDSKQVVNIAGPCTYRVHRQACGSAVAVDIA